MLIKPMRFSLPRDFLLSSRDWDSGDETSSRPLPEEFVIQGGGASRESGRDVILRSEVGRSLNGGVGGRKLQPWKDGRVI